MTRSTCSELLLDNRHIYKVKLTLVFYYEDVALLTGVGKVVFFKCISHNNRFLTSRMAETSELERVFLKFPFITLFLLQTFRVNHVKPWLER